MPARYVKLRRRCEALLEQLDPPRPFSLDLLRQRLEAQRGRTLHLHPLPLQAATAGACGLWLATSTDDHIFFEQQTTRSHQEHIVLHEIGHMLFDHHSVGADEFGGLTTLLPDLSPRLIERLLGRTDYTTREEQEAEMFASVLGTWQGRLRGGDPAGTVGSPNPLEAALGVGTSRDR
ncbi:hypothetical protein AB0D12_30995 [Streptomyces sp. NPDC048479]|uniref:hypothetical protein n=1 Tax=Streptomyces sp. NPDC048479 TaxID=3154725 RepID=UPI003433EE51